MAQALSTPNGRAVSLKPAQEIVLASLADREAVELTRSDYEEISGVSRSQAAYDIAELVSLGVLERVGSGRSTRYYVVSGGAGRPKKWTEERIRSELGEFHAQLGRWPRAADFRESGRSDLYVAACRNGGIGRWARELSPREVTEETSAGERDSRPWLSYALVLAACLGALTFAGPQKKDIPAGPGAHAQRLDDAKASARQAVAAVAAVRAAKAQLVLTASDTAELTVRRRSAGGRVFFAGLLPSGGSVRITAQRIWADIASPSALAARLDGQALRLPARPAIVVITPDGIRSVKPRATPSQGPGEVAPAATTPAQTTAPAATISTSPATSASASPQTSSPSPDAQPTPDSPPAGPSPDHNRKSR